jgi:hypothetical protein
MALKSTRWLKAFTTFTEDLRIRSREVVSTDARGDKLVMWESQRRFMKEVGAGLDRDIHIFNCLKSRQLGITTISLALVDIFWLAVHPGIYGCLITDDEKKREVNRSMIEGYINSFPDGYFGEDFKIVKNNRQMMLFSNNSRLDLLVAGVKKKPNTGWAEGVGYAVIHATEVSSYGDAEGLKSLEEGFAQTNPHRLMVLESTAKGYNHWRTRWMQGVNDPLMQRSFFIGWWAGDVNAIKRSDPRFLQFGGYPPAGEERELCDQVLHLYNHKITPEQLAWIRWKTVNAGEEQNLLEQNQPFTADQAFVLTGYSFFQTRMVNRQIKDLLDQHLIFQGYRYEVDGDFFNFRMIRLDPTVDSIDSIELKIWEEPVESAKYVVGFDPAYGRTVHKDSHAISVWRCFADRMVQVAEYCTANVEVKHAAWVMFHLCAAYRDCMMNVEITGPGELVMTEFKHLRQLLSAEMNRTKTEDRGWQDAANQARWFLYHREDSFGSGYAANYKASRETKERMMHKFRGAFVSNELIIRSVKLLHEMNNVIVDDDVIGAPESKDEDKKDDRVFSAGLACVAWIDWIRTEMIQSGLNYDYVMKMESDEATPTMKAVNSIVRNFFKRADEEAEAPPPPDWRERAGLA